MLSKKINRKKGVWEGVCHCHCSCCIAATGAVAAASAAASAAATPTPAIVCPSFAHPHSQPVLVHIHSHVHHGCCCTRLPLGPHSVLSICAHPRLSAPTSFVCAHCRPRSSVCPVSSTCAHTSHCAFVPAFAHSCSSLPAWLHQFPLGCVHPCLPALVPMSCPFGHCMASVSAHSICLYPFPWSLVRLFVVILTRSVAPIPTRPCSSLPIHTCPQVTPIWPLHGLCARSIACSFTLIVYACSFYAFVWACLGLFGLWWGSLHALQPLIYVYFEYTVSKYMIIKQLTFKA